MDTRLFIDLIAIGNSQINQGISFLVFLELGDLYKPDDEETIYLYATTFDVEGRNYTSGHAYSSRKPPAGYGNPGAAGLGFTVYQGAQALSSHNEMMCVGGAQTPVAFPMQAGDAFRAVLAGDTIRATCLVFDVEGNTLGEWTDDLTVPPMVYTNIFVNPVVRRDGDPVPGAQPLVFAPQTIANRPIYTQRGTLPYDYITLSSLNEKPWNALAPGAGPAVHNLSKKQQRDAIAPFFDAFPTQSAVNAWRHKNGDIGQPAGFGLQQEGGFLGDGNTAYFYNRASASVPPPNEPGGTTPITAQGAYLGFGYAAGRARIAATAPNPIYRWNNGNAVEWITTGLGSPGWSGGTNGNAPILILHQSNDYGSTAKRMVIPAVYEKIAVAAGNGRIYLFGWRSATEPFILPASTGTVVEKGTWYIKVGTQVKNGRYEWGEEQPVDIPQSLMPAPQNNPTETGTPYDPVFGSGHAWIRPDGMVCLGFINGSWEDRDDTDNVPTASNYNSMLAVAASISAGGDIVWSSVQRIPKRMALPLLEWRGKLLAGGNYNPDTLADGTFGKYFILGTQQPGGQYGEWSAPFSLDNTALGGSVGMSPPLLAREDGSLEHFLGGGLNTSIRRTGTQTQVEKPYRCPNLQRDGKGKWTIASVV